MSNPETPEPTAPEATPIPAPEAVTEPAPEAVTPWRPPLWSADGLPEARPSKFSGRAPLVGLVAATVVLGAFAAVAAFHQPEAKPANQAYVDTAATDQVKAAARATLTTLYGYDAAHIDGWKDAADKVITGKMRQDFDKTADVTVSGIKQTGVKTDVNVDPIGVTQLQGDQAEVLVNLQVSSSRSGQIGDSAKGPLVLRMVKVDGRWLGSDVVDKD